MFHFIYKTVHSSGKYYVGRHSTKNINDGYVGSGRWVKSVKYKNLLTREIVKFCDSYEELIVEEQKFIEQNLESPLCMNWTNASIGFGTGKYNPRYENADGMPHTEETKKKISENRKGKNTGVNNCMTGKPATEKNKQATSKVNSGTYKITFPDGNVVTITNMLQFCKEHGLIDVVFYRYHNKGKPYKGFTFTKIA